MLPSLFNDVIGPVMRGPSSSHCAAALRVGRLARDLMDGSFDEVLVEFDRQGSLPTTHESQGSDMGLFGGLLGWEATDERLPRSPQALRDLGVQVRIETVDAGDPHPNTYRLTLRRGAERHFLRAISTGGGGAMTARDWAVFGEFVRLSGQWNGKQIIRKELLTECLQGTKPNPAYGLTWWLKRPVPDSLLQQVLLLRREMEEIVRSDWLPEDLFMAAGAGKQRLYVIPSLKLVIVRQGAFLGSRSFSDAEFLEQLLRGKEEGK